MGTLNPTLRWPMLRPLLKLSARLLLVAMPVVLLGVYYLWVDPFLVLRHYPTYYPTHRPTIWVNRDVASTETFLRQHRPEQPYDAFILGNSRSIFYQANDWLRHIGPSRVFHFDASLESLYGISQKIKWLDRRSVRIRHALLVVDFSVLRNVENEPSHLYTKHYAVSGEAWGAFQLKFLKAFFNLAFLKSYLTTLLNPPLRYWSYEQQSNEISYPVPEDSIRRYPQAYYAKRKEVFYQRDTTQSYYAPTIGTQQQTMLRQIKTIFDKYHTDYRIVVSPMYDQLRLDSTDVRALVEVFGASKVFDYSGINRITQSPINYYERYHYRPHVARQILDEIYSQKK